MLTIFTITAISSSTRTGGRSSCSPSTKAVFNYIYGFRFIMVAHCTITTFRANRGTSSGIGNLPFSKIVSDGVYIGILVCVSAFTGMKGVALTKAGGRFYNVAINVSDSIYISGFVIITVFTITALGSTGYTSSGINNRPSAHIMGCGINICILVRFSAITGMCRIALLCTSGRGYDRFVSVSGCVNGFGFSLTTSTLTFLHTIIFAGRFFGGFPFTKAMACSSYGAISIAIAAGTRMRSIAIYRAGRRSHNSLIGVTGCGNRLCFTFSASARARFHSIERTRSLSRNRPFTPHVGMRLYWITARSVALISFTSGYSVVIGCGGFRRVLGFHRNFTTFIARGEQHRANQKKESKR